MIYVFISIKVFLLVTKHEPEAVEQQGELQNDGSLSIVAPRSFKRRNSRLENLRQNAELVEVSDIGQTTTNFKIYYLQFEGTSVNLAFCLHSLP